MLKPNPLKSRFSVNADEFVLYSDTAIMVKIKIHLIAHTFL
jgi:hypothetical protein